MSSRADLSISLIISSPLVPLLNLEMRPLMIQRHGLVYDYMSPHMSLPYILLKTWLSTTSTITSNSFSLLSAPRLEH